MTTNLIKLTSADIETAKGIGPISTLTFDLGFTVEPVASANPMVPAQCVLGRFPHGKLFERGGIWKKQNTETETDCYTLTIRDHGINTKLGKAANMGDMFLESGHLLGAVSRRLCERLAAFASANPFTTVNSRVSQVRVCSLFMHQ